MSLNTLDCPRCGAPLDPPIPAGSTMECPYCQITVVIPETLRTTSPSNQPTPDLAQLAELGRLIQAGKKIDAIKLVRQTTDLGLKQAKELVEAMQRGEPVNFTSFQTGAPADLLAGAGVPDIPPGLEAELRTLLAHNNRTGAIRLLRERLDISLGVADTTLAILANGTPLETALPLAGWKAVTQRSTASQQAREQRAEYIRAQMSSASATRAAAGKGAAGCSALSIFLLSIGILLPLLMVCFFLFAPLGPFGELGSRLNPMGFARLEASFGAEGQGQGMFTDLRDLAVAPDGTLYTAEYETGRIQHFDEQGNFLNLFFIPGSEWNDEVYIADLEVDSAGLLYVTQGGDIRVYDGYSGTELFVLDLEISGDSLFIDDLAFGPDGTPYALARETLLRFDSHWQPEVLRTDVISSITRDSETTLFLTLDGTGAIYILGGNNYSVFKFDRDGNYQTRFGSRGEETGQFWSVDEIDVDGYGRVFVSDFNGIFMFDSDGRFLRKLPIPGIAFDLTFDTQNRLWIASNNERVMRYIVQAP